MKDLFEHLANQKIGEINIRNILRSAYFVPETKNTDALFKELQSTKNHIAILIDEYGGFVVNLLGTIPKENENHTVEYENLTFKIQKVSEKRIEELKLCIG